MTHTERLPSPEFAGVQFAPLSVERKTPPPIVAAKRSVSIPAREYTSVLNRPEFIAAHESPLSVERLTPPPPGQAAKRFVPETRKSYTCGLIGFVFDGVQVEPSFVDRYARAPCVPAKIFCPFTPRERIKPPSGPLVCVH